MHTVVRIKVERAVTRELINDAPCVHDVIIRTPTLEQVVTHAASHNVTLSFENDCEKY